MPDEFVKDTFERPIISLRITITNRCNENCIYCHHDGMVSSKDEMTPDEIYRICKIAKKLGVKKIRLSGGDPLVRKDIVEIVEKIGSLNFKDISLTSNGVLLEKYAKDLKEAGLNRVNISLDSLNRDTYKFVTNMDYLNEAKAGILKSVEVGLYPVKINGIESIPTVVSFGICTSVPICFRSLPICHTQPPCLRAVTFPLND